MAERAVAEYEDGAEQVVVEAEAAVGANSSAVAEAQVAQLTYCPAVVRQAEVSAAADPDSSPAAAAATDLDTERPVSTAAVEVAEAVAAAELSAAAVPASSAPHRTSPFHHSPLYSSPHISSSLCLSERSASPRSHASSSN